MGLVSGLNTECPKAPGKGGFEEKQKQKNKNQRWRESVTSIPACVTTPKMEISEIRGRWAGDSFLVNASKPSRLRPENTRQAK